MNPTASDIRSMSCVTIKAPEGWLAVSSPYSPIRIGVAAPTESEAAEAFSKAAEAWSVLRDLPDGAPAG
jgi:hypothetical protein